MLQVNNFLKTNKVKFFMLYGNQGIEFMTPKLVS